MTADFGSAMIAFGAEHAGLEVVEGHEEADVQFGVAMTTTDEHIFRP